MKDANVAKGYQIKSFTLLEKSKQDNSDRTTRAVTKGRLGWTSVDSCSFVSMVRKFSSIVNTAI